MSHASAQRPLATLKETFFYPFVVIGMHLPLLMLMHRGKIGDRGLRFASPTELVGYFHADLMLYVLLALVLAAARPLRRHSFVLFLPFYFIALFDWLSWSIQAKTFFFADIYRAVQILLFYPEFAEGIATATKLKTAVLALAPIVPAAFIRIGPVSTWMLGHQRLLNRLAGAGVLVFLLLLAPLYSRDYFLDNSMAFMLSEQLHQRQLEAVDLDVDRVRQKLGHTANQQPLSTSAPNRRDVVFFIIETTPYPLMPDIAATIASLGDTWLDTHFVSFANHYSTYPASDRATFSILSGKYPPMVENNDWKQTIDYGLPLAQRLAAEGYTTWSLSTAPLDFYGDRLMHERLGFEHIEDVNLTKSLRTKTDYGYRWQREKLYSADKKLVALALAAIARQPAGKPLFLTIAPQSSHAPFQCPPDLPEDACDSDRYRIRANLAWQLQLLERVIREMRAVGRDFILVITGDHGIRSPHESTLFSDGQRLQEITFHVPLLIAARGLPQAHSAGNLTSHVDLAPTILDLLGLNYNRDDYHGINLFEARERTVFFVGKGYLPIDGFWQQGTFYMRNIANRFYFANNAPNFQRMQGTPTDETLRTFINRELLFFEAYLKRDFE